MLFLDSRQARDSPLSALYGNLRSILKGPVECLNFLRGGAYHLGRGERRTSITNRRRVREREEEEREDEKAWGLFGEESGLCFVSPLLLLHSFICELSPAFLPPPLSPSHTHSFVIHTYIYIYTQIFFFLSFSTHFCFITKVM
jgi:hypothetical protein